MSDHGLNAEPAQCIYCGLSVDRPDAGPPSRFPVDFCSEACELKFMEDTRTGEEGPVRPSQQDDRWW